MESEQTKPALTREGLFGYFDQMADANGKIETTADWLADTGMMIANESRQSPAPAWRAIRSEDDLPKEDGDYLWIKIGTKDFVYDHWDVHCVNPEYQLTRYTAWHKIPPYAPDKPELTTETINTTGATITYEKGTFVYHKDGVDGQEVEK